MAKAAIAKASTAVFAHSDTAPVSLSSALAPHVAGFLAETLARIGEPSIDEAALWRASAAGEQMEIAGRLIAGAANRELCTRVHNIDDALRVHGKNRRSFFYSIQLLEVFEALPDQSSVMSLALLDFTTIRLMMSWSAEERRALTAGEKVRGITLNDARDLPSRDLAIAIRDPEAEQLKKKIKALEADKEGLQSDLKEAQGALKHRYETLKMPDFAAHARQEAIALAEQMTLSVTALEDLITDHLGSKEAIHTFPEWRERAAGTLYHSVRAVHARTQQLLQRVEEDYGEGVTGKIDYEHSLSAGEMLLARDALDVITKRHNTQAENREAARKNAKGQRGRPRQIKAES